MAGRNTCLTLLLDYFYRLSPKNVCSHFFIVYRLNWRGITSTHHFTYYCAIIENINLSNVKLIMVNIVSLATGLDNKKESKKGENVIYPTS